MNVIVSRQQINEIFKQVRYDHENQRCIDCGQSSPIWASITYGIFLCADCAAIHRSMGSNVSFVRSTILDQWTLGQLWRMVCGGNRRARDNFSQSQSNDIMKRYNSDVGRGYVKVLDKEVSLHQEESEKDGVTYLMNYLREKEQSQQQKQLGMGVQKVVKHEMNWENLGTTSGTRTSRFQKVSKSLKELENETKNKIYAESQTNISQRTIIEDKKTRFTEDRKVKNVETATRKPKIVHHLDDQAVERFGLGIVRIKKSDNYTIGDEVKIEEKVKSTNAVSSASYFGKPKNTSFRPIIRTTNADSVSSADYFETKRTNDSGNVSASPAPVNLKALKTAFNTGAKKLRNAIDTISTSYLDN